MVANVLFRATFCSSSLANSIFSVCYFCTNVSHRNMEGQRKYLISQKHFSASGCPHANKNRARSIETSLGMGAGGLLKYGGLIKPSIHSVPYPAPPGSTDVSIFF